jgi:hypothetical protein
MINLSDYARLLVEQKLSDSQIGSIVYNLYRLKFDLDTDQIELSAAKRIHNSEKDWQFFKDDHVSVNLTFIYYKNNKNIFVNVVNDLKRYKFSTSEVDSINKIEDEELYADLMKKGDVMPHYGLTKDTLLKRDNQNSFTATISIWKGNPYEYEKKYKIYPAPNVYFGVGDFYNRKGAPITNLEDLVDLVKNKIDKYLGGGSKGDDGGGDDTPAPQPPAPKTGKLVTV